MDLWAQLYDTHDSHKESASPSVVGLTNLEDGETGPDPTVSSSCNLNSTGRLTHQADKVGIT